MRQACSKGLGLHLRCALCPYWAVLQPKSQHKQHYREGQWTAEQPVGQQVCTKDLALGLALGAGLTCC